MIYNWPKHKAGDTFDGLSFTLSINGEAADLDGASVTIQFKENPSDEDPALTLSNPGDITITDNEIAVDAFDPILGAGTYVYEMQVVYASGRKKTYLKGSWVIVDEVNST